jgi:hypothetical protein
MFCIKVCCYLQFVQTLFVIIVFQPVIQSTNNISSSVAVSDLIHALGFISEIKPHVSGIRIEQFDATDSGFIGYT